MIILIAAVLGSYLLGSIPSALWVGRLVRRLDIREHGSGNMGAANAVRVLGLPWGVFVGFVDVAKGFVAAFWLGSFLAGNFPISADDAGMLCGATAIIGHLYPLFAGFRGGKGVLTALGIFAALLPFDIGVAVVGWITLFAATRIVSVGSLTAALALAASVIMRRLLLGHAIADSLVVAALMITVLVFYTHRANIRRLLAGEESRFRRS